MSHPQGWPLELPDQSTGTARVLVATKKRKGSFGRLPLLRTLSVNPRREWIKKQTQQESQLLLERVETSQVAPPPARFYQHFELCSCR